MQTEHDLLELDHSIKSTLQLSSADPDRCIALFSDYKGNIYFLMHLHYLFWFYSKSYRFANHRNDAEKESIMRGNH